MSPRCRLIIPFPNSRLSTSTPKPEPASSTKFPEPRGKGSVIQVRAFPTFAEAEALATRLKAKGYPVFITVNDDTATRTPFRVRLGKYTKTSDVEAVSRRLIQEERIKPWLIP